MTTPSPPVSSKERGEDEGPTGYRLGIVVNFSEAKVEYQRVLIR